MAKEKKVVPEEKISSPEDGKRRRRIIRTAITTLIIIVLILLGLHRCGYSGSQGKGDSGVIIGAGVQEGELDGEGKMDKTEVNSNGKSEMTVRMNGYPVFADGEGAGNLNIENPAVNELHMNVEIMLNSTGELIYDSGTIPPNHYIDSDRLDKVLEKGIYEATAHVTLFDPEYPDDDYNSANFTLIITIEN